MQTTAPQLTKFLHCHEQEREIPLVHRDIKTLFYIMGGIQQLKKDNNPHQRGNAFYYKGIKKNHCLHESRLKLLCEMCALTLKTHCCIITNTSCKLEHVFCFVFLSFWLNYLCIVYSIWKKRSLSFGIFSTVNRLKIIDQTSRVFSLDILWKLESKNTKQKPKTKKNLKLCGSSL